ncbi:hypothetical protein GCM10010272_34880 [Streptomyces lateritius]|nr:hypothetical protein GCM10010272_34880 [Streptomyces lateritius]
MKGVDGQGPEEVVHGAVVGQVQDSGGARAGGDDRGRVDRVRDADPHIDAVAPLVAYQSRTDRAINRRRSAAVPPETHAAARAA